MRNILLLGALGLLVLGAQANEFGYKSQAIKADYIAKELNRLSLSEEYQRILRVGYSDRDRRDGEKLFKRWKKPEDLNFVARGPDIYVYYQNKMRGFLAVKEGRPGVFLINGEVELRIKKGQIFSSIRKFASQYKAKGKGGKTASSRSLWSQLVPEVWAVESQTDGGAADTTWEDFLAVSVSGHTFVTDASAPGLFATLRVTDSEPRKSEEASPWDRLVSKDGEGVVFSKSSMSCTKDKGFKTKVSYGGKTWDAVYEGEVLTLSSKGKAEISLAGSSVAMDDQQVSRWWEILADSAQLDTKKEDAIKSLVAYGQYRDQFFNKRTLCSYHVVHRIYGIGIMDGCGDVNASLADTIYACLKKSHRNY
ncbi:MAG: hypothetical protein KDD43_11390, partial [Bdellovibrionales bacterium]|nr:hypothetical protein [Bdellovibrionales bacterium]